jgi:hypothetical protein
VNEPTLNKKSAKVDGSCAQHRVYSASPAVPAVAVLKGNSLYGSLVESVVEGFVSPERDAKALVPQVAVDKIMRTAFVDADPVVVHDSCKSQLAVNVHSSAW